MPKAFKHTYLCKKESFNDIIYKKKFKKTIDFLNKYLTNYTIFYLDYFLIENFYNSTLRKYFKN